MTTPWRERHRIVPAVYLIFRRNDQVLLLKRANTGYRDGWYGLPSGHLDGGESARQGGIREAKEEVGVDIELKDLRFVNVQHRVAEEGDHERVDFFFEVDSWQGEPVNAEPQKCEELCWVPTDKLPEQMIPEVKQVLQCVAAGQFYSESGFDQ